MTQFEPYFLAFGTHPRQVYHNALDLAPNWTRCDNRDDMLIELAVARIQAQENQYKNQLKNKAQVDKKRVDSTFQPGDLVLLKEPTWRRRRNGKLKNIFTGPHVVTAILSPVLVRIATKGDDGLIMNVRADRLKTYHVRPTTYSSPSERTSSTDSENDADSEAEHEDQSSEATEVYYVEDLQGEVSLEERLKRATRRPARLNDYVSH